mmetsp:Transcript_40219/g.85793  ORF Transcript_40219/g.85793 Transcript_40219/m.85793 type:complete len:117 (-) Transcript_40219:17-367(-)
MGSGPWSRSAALPYLRLPVRQMHPWLLTSPCQRSVAQPLALPKPLMKTPARAPWYCPQEASAREQCKLDCPKTKLLREHPEHLHQPLLYNLALMTCLLEGVCESSGLSLDPERLEP